MKFLKNLAATAIFGIVLVQVFCVGTRTVGVPRETVARITAETAPAENPDKLRIAQLEAQVTELSQDKARLTAEVEKYMAQERETCVLVLRYEELVLSSIFGDTFVVERAVQEIAVSRELYDSCRTGDDITNLELHRLMTCDGLSETRVIVQSKFIRS